MIKSIRLTRFKKYKNQEFYIHAAGISLLVGGNNSENLRLYMLFQYGSFAK